VSEHQERRMAKKNEALSQIRAFIPFALSSSLVRPLLLVGPSQSDERPSPAAAAAAPPTWEAARDEDELPRP
jgi:hypothetical protein